MTKWNDSLNLYVFFSMKQGGAGSGANPRNTGTEMVTHPI